MEARYCRSRKHEHFRDPKSPPQNHQPCTCPDTYLVGPRESELFSTGPKSGSVGPGGSQPVGRVGLGGSQPFSTWDPRGGPMITMFTAQ